MSGKTQRVSVLDDSRLVETTKRFREKFQAEGIEEPQPDFAAAAEGWKAKREIMRSYRFVVIIKPEDGGYHAYCPAVEDCHARGGTPQEARTKLLDLLYAHLSALVERGEIPPSDDGFAETVNVLLPAGEPR